MSALLEVVLHDGVRDDGVRHLRHQVEHQTRNRVDSETLHRIKITPLLVDQQGNHRGDHLLGRWIREDIWVHQA